MTTDVLALTARGPDATLAREGSTVHPDVRPAAREAEPGRQGLWLGILAYRWASYVWMTTLAVVIQADGEFEHPALGWTLIVITGLWTLWFSVARGWERATARGIDLALAMVLVAASGYVVTERSVVFGDVPFFATSYPASAAMTMGAARGVTAGLGSGLLLSLALFASRPINGVTLGEIDWAALGNGAFYYLAAGGAVGLIDQVLTRSGEELRRASEEATRERERAARLAERESIARRIHDSVLQTLTLISKRGTELSLRPVVPSEDVRALAELATDQQRALRTLIQGSIAEPPTGTVALRTVLEAAAFGVREIPVEISAVEPIWLPSACVEEVSAAIHQALENVVEHAEARRVSLFAETAQHEVVITVRDDGSGFVYDEDRLREDGKLGLLISMKGRIEELGGSMRVDTAPGKGTEIEFRLPAPPQIEARTEEET
jgi:signal transduction histidine kinase